MREGTALFPHVVFVVLMSIIGLSAEGGSSLAMVPSRVTKLPSGATPFSQYMIFFTILHVLGTESGTAIALDIGGSNLRALKVRFNGNGGFEQLGVVKKQISANLQSGTAADLFDFIATTIKELLAKADENEHIKGDQAGDTNAQADIGFTFSFPLNQTALNAGILTKWTKGFTTVGVVGKDVCELLGEALERQVRYTIFLLDYTFIHFFFPPLVFSV